MSASNRNQNSANQNSTGEEVPLTAVTPAQDGNNSDQGTNKSQSEGQKQSTGNSGTGKDANDNADMYNPETALAATGLDIIPEGFNLYRNKKTLTQGLMDIALFSANANQLRYILDHGSSNAIFYIIASLLIISLILQVGVGLLLLLSTRYNLSVACQRELVYRYGNYVVIGIFLITVVNLFIAAFGGSAVSVLPTPAPTPNPLPSLRITANNTDTVEVI